jgi:SSS family solute:Na+ symporter
MGRLTNVLAVLLSIGAAYSALSFQSLMEYIQMILSTFNAPIFALVALAALTPKRTGGGGLIGLFAGLGSAGLHQALVFAGFLHYGSRMSANFYAAIFSFCVTAVATVISASFFLRKVSVLGIEHAAAEHAVRGHAPEEHAHTRIPLSYSIPTLAWALVVSSVCIAVNIWLR